MNAATHESALPNPPTNRTSTSSDVASTSANITLVTDIRVKPTRAVTLTPDREARYPPGTLPTSTPAPYAPLKIPTVDLERPNSSWKNGTSGYSAA